MLDIDFIRNLTSVLFHRRIFLDYIEDYFLHIIAIILFSIFIGWLTRRIWKNRKSIIIPFIIFVVPLILISILGVTLGAPSPMDVLWLIYMIVVTSYWIVAWIKDKVRVRNILFNYGIIFIVVILSLILLLGVLANVFVAYYSHPIMDARIESEMSQLRTEAELNWTFDLGYSDFSCTRDKTTNFICDDIDQYCILAVEERCKGDDTEGGKQDVVIHATKDKYCAYTSLPASDTWDCISNEGSSRETNINPVDYCTEDSFECPK